MIHTANDRTPYTYVIKNLTTGKRYYGCRYAKNCHPSEFWKTYFTSSKIVKKLIKEAGKENWYVEIRHIFSDINLCKAWEEKALHRLGVPKNPMWYNQSIGGKKFLLQGDALELHKKNAPARTLKRLSNPEAMKAFYDAQKIRWEKPGAKEAHSRKIKECWEDNEWAEKVCQDRKDRASTPEERERRSKTSLEFWGRPEYREKHAASMEIVRSDPVWLEANREHMRKAWADPIKREKMLAARTPASDELCQKRSVIASIANKSSWTNPETRAKRIAGIKLACAKRKAAKIAASLLSTDDQIARPCPPNRSLREMR